MNEPDKTDQKKSVSVPASGSIFLIVSGLALLGIGLASGYYLGNNHQSSSPLTITPSPTPIPHGRPWPQIISEEKNIKTGKR